MGTGFLECRHGVLPVPAPATVELLRDVPVYQTKRKQELVTPTGAAIITTLSSNFGDMSLMKINKIGYGAGKTKSKYPTFPQINIMMVDGLFFYSYMSRLSSLEKLDQYLIVQKFQ